MPKREPLPPQEPSSEGRALGAVREPDERRIFAGFTPEQQEEIKRKQQILSSLAFFIGKDFRIPVMLNEPGAGWHWDFEKNEIRIDPKDLLVRPIEYLRFLICHEAGHRRVSRMDFISREEWSQPGFAFMMNAIEDPRTNNFVAESYPKFKDDMDQAYAFDLDIEKKADVLAKEKLGYRPRFMRAGFEYIRQWFLETREEGMKVSDDLPEDVKAVVKSTLNAAKDSWWRYPSRAEADAGEDLVKGYAKRSYEINRDRIWPEFKKLVEMDRQDQMTQEFLNSPAADDFKKTLDDDERKPFESIPVPIGDLPQELRDRIRVAMQAQPDDVKERLEEQAKKAMEEFEQDISDALEGKLEDDPDRKAERESKKAKPPEDEAERPKTKEPPREPAPKADEDEVEKYRKQIAETLNRNENAYERVRREVLPVIDRLEQELRDIFTARRAHQWKTGFKTGKKIDIKKRMQEKVKGVSAVESRAWQKREMPDEKDYAISLLVDLSGSMQGEKIHETFKAVIVLAEVLNKLSIKTEILGFNSRIKEFERFGSEMSKEIREKMGQMLGEVSSPAAAYNDDGWALEQASARLATQKAKEKFLIVLSDGQPEESMAHASSEYELGQMVKKIMKETDQRLIGLGIGRGTKHVERYYPNSLANIGITEMAEKLSSVIREAIASPDAF